MDSLELRRHVVDKGMEEETNSMVGGAHGPWCGRPEAEKGEVDVDDVGEEFEDVDMKRGCAGQGEGRAGAAPHKVKLKAESLSVCAGVGKAVHKEADWASPDGEIRMVWRNVDASGRPVEGRLERGHSKWPSS